ncbi:aminotransferase class I/II-fold pyridoxal phosphate-dependent enzyme [Flavobacteriaceae bacterium TP-CH-4]|uniref:Aminotransferase class I/II-fold pyridoxal phosphate-dependent enzyme n=1 Tax=Pelagihabitans pacificus TaxID=2696054 RepID=A0A967AZK7_9FLAO|nr:aminotransferase class I/II-fold pyridoxal phosphate-dependent enzyme [Pelagihabitans pacificus]NHF59426.1 aminotransferase class I/II-fold pyridoxal phosphate-dependent enzyme [Pelagihabitans pacificus]
MNKNLLKSAYSPEDFRKRGHQLINELADHLSDKLHGKSQKAIHWNLPEDELNFWKEFLRRGDDASLFSEITKRTTYVHHPHYIGHQVSPSAPITALSGMISSLLNNGMAVYEMGMSPSAIERVVTDILCKKIGYNADSRGFLTSGGTLANLTALLSARKAKVVQDVWNEGHSGQLGIMVSEEAHYCVDRAAKIMGLGEKGIIKIPATNDFEMDTSLLEKRYQQATEKGIRPFAIIGSAPSTATGVYDNLEVIGQFAQQHNLWFHVDGAHGGAAIFSEKYRYTVHGIELADSVVIDGHKMMMMPTITTALLMREGKYANATFSQKAEYLLTEADHEDWYNSGKRTFECTKTMMSIHWYTMFKVYGEGVFDEFVTQLYDMGRLFGDIIEKEPDFELAVAPVSNIVCFRFVDATLDTKALNKLNANIRQQLLEDGEFYIVQTKLRGIHYLRVTVMNPFTTEFHFKKLLGNIKGILENSRLTKR